MTGLVRTVALWSAAGLLVASAAMAGVPSGSNSSVPSCISLLGSSGGVPDVVGSFTVIVRDLANNPLGGASVVIDLSGCTDITMCCDQLDAAALVNCAAKTTRKFTDILGHVSFVVLGSSNGANNATTLLGGGRIYANGTLIGSPTISAYDLDNTCGVAIGDLTPWLIDFGSGQNWGRSDYDCNGTIGANDLSLWLTDFGNGASYGSSCGVPCP